MVDNSTQSNADLDAKVSADANADGGDADAEGHLEHNQAEHNQAKHNQNDIDWDKRTLCSDESCIGVIGPDGRCKECALPYKGGQKESDVLHEYPYDNYGLSAEGECASVPADSDWESRTLCRDESCIGVIGPDKRCKECGLPLSSL